MKWCLFSPLIERERERTFWGQFIYTHTHKHNQSLVRFIFRAWHKHTHKRHYILKIDGEEAEEKVRWLSFPIEENLQSHEKEERERERDEHNKNEKNKKNNNCIVVYIVVVAKRTMMVFYVCVFRGAQSKWKRLRRVFWSAKNFLFFVKRDERDAKKHQMAAKNEKIQKFCSFCSFFALWRAQKTETPTNGTLSHAQILQISLV